MIRRAKPASLLARHTNQQDVWKFIIGSDKAGGVNYTHLTLETSLEPATAKTSLTIAGIYDTNDNFERRTKILNKMTHQFTKLHLVHRVSVNFEALTDTPLLTLKNVFSHKEDRFIEKQTVAKRQLETRLVPSPEVGPCESRAPIFWVRKKWRSPCVIFVGALFPPFFLQPFFF